MRKGVGSAAPLAQGVELRGALRSTLPNAETPCVGGFAGYRLDLEHVGLAFRLGACTAETDTALLRASVQAFDLDVRAYRAWDVSRLALSLGAGAGAGYFVQRFDTRGAAPARHTLVPFVALTAGADYDLASGWYLALEAAAETHFLPLADGKDGAHGPASFALRTRLGAGKRW